MTDLAKIDVVNEFLDFLLSTPTRRNIIDFKPSEAAQMRVEELLDAVRSGTSSDQEELELDQILLFNNIMATLRARGLLLERQSDTVQPSK